VPRITDPGKGVRDRRSRTIGQLDALDDFVHSDRYKRVVLVGEWNDGYSVSNAYLNSIACAIGMHIRFGTVSGSYDNDIDRQRLCPVNGSHYLASGALSGLWDTDADHFVDVGDNAWSLWSNPVAYLYDQQTRPFIVEEDTADAGSRVAIHDSSIFLPDYGMDYDIVPDKNVRFVYNLCTRFPSQ